LFFNASVSAAFFCFPVQFFQAANKILIVLILLGYRFY
jgi:hypothetical protein